MIIVSADDWPIAEKLLGLFSGGRKRLIDTQLDLSFAVEFFEQLHFRKGAARILDLSPAEFNIALHSQNDRLLCLGRGGWRQMPAHQILRRVKQHAVWRAALFLF